jgi:hypothetical protein
MKRSKKDLNFFFANYDECILALDEKIYGSLIGEFMQQYRAVQFFSGTMFFQGNDAAEVMNLPLDAA